MLGKRMNHQKKKSVLMVAGEASGDLHGAKVVREILKRDPTVYVYGIGGTEMEKAGMHLIGHTSDLALTGFSELFLKIRKIWGVFHLILKSVPKHRPKLALLIDYPDFNLRLAKRLNKLRIPILYYISPQIWAWRRYRAKFIKRWISKMLVVFPFEKTFYQSMNIEVDFVGHPLLETPLPSRELSNDPSKRVIVLMPGSRSNEISSHLQIMLEAAEIIYAKHPDVAFVLPMASTVDPKVIHEAIKHTKVKICVTDRPSREVLSLSHMVICCSGTSTLEATIHGKPMVVVLKLNRLTYFLASIFFNAGVQFFAMPNVIAAKCVVPELIQSKVTSENIVREALRFLNDQRYYEKTVGLLKGIQEKLGQGEASKQVVDHVFHYLNREDRNLTIRKHSMTLGRLVSRSLMVLVTPLLWGMSLFYGLIVKVRRYLYWTNILKPKEVPVRVVSVGNLSTGGTGKTPLTIQLSKILTKQGTKVGIVSRGYKRESKNDWECVTDGQTIGVSVQTSGDEPMLMANKLKNIPIYVGANRYKVAQEVLKRHDLDVLLLDDGYQHWQLKRDFDFLTLDVSSFKHTAQLLPLGRLREPLSHIKRSNCVVLTRTDHVDAQTTDMITKKVLMIHPSVPIVEANYQSKHFRNIYSNDILPLEAVVDKHLFAFAGIGNPYSFRRVIRGLGGVVVGFKKFPDHFRYKKRHLESVQRSALKLKADYIITTEKDAVRISKSGELSIPIYALVVDLEITKGMDIFQSIVREL